MKKIIMLLSLVCIANLVFAQWGYYCPPPNPYAAAAAAAAQMQQQMQNGWNNFNSNTWGNSTPMPVVVPDNSSSTSSSSTSNEYKRTKKTCRACNGKGWVPETKGVPSFGNSKWCSDCGREVPSSHYHATCPSCNGAGKW